MEKGYIRLTEKQLQLLKLLLSKSTPMQVFTVQETQNELARELGVTRQALNVHLRRLREEGLVRTGRGFIDLTEKALEVIGVKAADVFVLPSHLPSEAFGLVSVEAMASGLPVIATELGTGTSEVVSDGHTGLVVPPADPHALSTALNRLLTDPELRRRLGSAGRDRARSRFSAEAYLDRTVRAYQAVLRAPRRTPVTTSIH